MFVVYTNSTPNKIYDINSNVSGFSSPAEFAAGFQPLTSFFSFIAGLSASCEYPLSVRDLFPYWMRIQSPENSVLISLTEGYYKWLACNTTDITDLSFLRLEDILNIETAPADLLVNFSRTYVDSLAENQIPKISPENLKNLIENIKTNLYSKKGTKDSVKYLINSLFGIDHDQISVSYPKRYIMRLNGGNYDWMRDNLNPAGQYSANPESFRPQLTGSQLNVSVIQDGDLWQEYSYVVNAPGLTSSYYGDILASIIHPIGTKYFVNTRSDIFNNTYDAASSFSSGVITVAEIPKIQNYTGYTLGSTQTIGYTFGCISGLSAPTYVFPSWDVEISAFPGISFGNIIINHFLELLPLPGGSFPNETIRFCSS